MFAKNLRGKHFANILIFAIIFMGALVVLLVALGSAGQDSNTQISVTAPSSINWNFDPTSSPYIINGDLIVNSNLPWRVVVQADTPAGDGRMAEYDAGSGYVDSGKKLNAPLEISADIRSLNLRNLVVHNVDLSTGEGVLLEGVGGEGELHIPIVFKQVVSWQDQPLHPKQGHVYVYHMDLSFVGSLIDSAPYIESLDVAPADGLVAPGGTATIKVVASGPTLTYQWFKGFGRGEFNYAFASDQYIGGYGIYGATLLKNGGHISGANKSTLTISNYDCSDNGTYYVIVSNLWGYEYAQNYLDEKYSIAIEPDSQWAPDPDSQHPGGYPVTFSAVVDPPGDYSYKWQRNTGNYAEWTDIPGATASTLNLPATPADDGRFFRVVVRRGDCTWRVFPWGYGYLRVGLHGPDDQNIFAWGEKVQLSVKPDDTQIFSYQWQSSDDGTNWDNKDGETGPTYAFWTTEADSNRKYQVIVTDKVTGSSEPSREAVIHKKIELDSETVGVCEGGTSPVRFAVNVTDFDVNVANSVYNFVYTWYISTDGGDSWQVAEDQGVWYLDRTVGINDNGEMFKVKIAKEYNYWHDNSWDESLPVTLTVYNRACIGTQPSSQAVCLGRDATFSVEATPDSVTYQWFKVDAQGEATRLQDDGHFSGTTDKTLIIHNAGSTDAADYHVVVTEGQHGTEVTSDDATLVVGLPPISGPPDKEVCPDSVVSFSVDPSNTEFYNYQWKVDGEPIPIADNPTAATPTLSFTATSLDNNKQYSVQVSNKAGDCSDGSRAATLKVTSEPDFRISLEDNPHTVRPQEKLNYTIGYLNRGCTATNAIVTANYDSRVHFMDADPDPDPGSNNKWTLGNLDHNHGSTIKIMVRADKSAQTDPDPIPFTVQLSCHEGATASASVSTMVMSDATLLYINKEASSQVIRQGDELDYTINYQNRGGGGIRFTNVTVNDTVDKHLQFEAATPPPTKIRTDDDGTHLWWSAADLGSQSMPAASSRMIMISTYLPDAPVYPNLESVYNSYDVWSNEMKGNFNTLETFVVHSLYIRKTSDKQAYSPGEMVNYTITYGTDNKNDDFRDVVIEDTLPDSKYIEYIDASLQPTAINGNVLTWSIGPLQGNTSRTIQLYARIRENCSEMNYKSSGSVSGEGFTNIRQNLDTAQNPDHLTNNVKIYDKILGELHSASATIKLADALGTAVNIRGHGSGTYQREDQTQMLMKNRSIQVKTSLSESYHPTTVALPLGRSIKYSSKWSEAQTGKNRITGATLSEVYMYADKIKRDSTINLDKNGSTLASETSFEGAGHVDVVKKECDNPKVAPTYESHEDYLGSFKVNTKVDDYGKNVVSNRSVSGTGMAASDKRIKESQRSYESGTGAYQVEDKMETQTNYMVKDINVSYAPVSYTYTPDFKVNLSKKWEEGMWSKSGSSSPKGSNSNKPASYIGEQFSGLDYLKKNTIAKGLNEMDTKAEFSGKAVFKVVKDSNSNNSNELNLYDLYIGKYKITRKTTITGVAKYDEPHLTISKVGKIEPAGGKYVSYKITVTNDGNKALEPVYVLDLFPPGTEYVSSSLRPTELASNYSRWTLTNLGIGSSSRIDLKLKMTDETGSLVNEVQTKGGYNNTWVTAENYSALRKGWLSCSLTQLLAAKEAYVDPKDPMLVHFRIFLKNRLNDTMAVTVTDQLPAEMEIINSTVAPAYHEPDKITWNIIEVKPGKNVTIDYLARALSRGTFVNQAHIDASYQHGEDSVSTDVTASVDIGAGTYSSSMSGWKPPSCFGMNCTDQGSADEWMPCYSCGESETEPIGGSQPPDTSCPSCVSWTGEEDNDLP